MAGSIASQNGRYIRLRPSPGHAAAAWLGLSRERGIATAQGPRAHGATTMMRQGGASAGPRCNQGQ
eukprot:358486-Chlamydomonas_euryale.AAC.8